MFGKNPIRKVSTDGQNLAIQDVFYTIQGEGPEAGNPAVFIRLAGCNLACTFCDTEFESGISNLQTIPQIINAVNFAASECRLARRGAELVVITGGEPLRQPLGDLIAALVRNGTRRIQIETAGTLWQPELEEWIHRGFLMLVCSPKTPKVADGVMMNCTNWKYIIRNGAQDPEDGLPNVSPQTGAASRLFRPWDHGRPAELEALDQIWVSPCDEQMPRLTAENSELAAHLAMRYGYRLSLQLHKLVNLP